jgi:hypothetical protein
MPHPNFGFAQSFPVQDHYNQIPSPGMEIARRRSMKFWLPLVASAFFGFTNPAFADVTYDFTNFQHCAGCVSATPSPAWTVVLSQEATNTVDVTVEGDFDWAVTGAGKDHQFFFDLSGNPTITVSDVTTGWELVSQTASSGGLAGDGFSGNFAYAMTCDYKGGACDKGGTSSNATPPLTFDVTATGLTPASFAEEVFGNNGATDGAYFLADMGVNGKTGLVGATPEVSAAEPSAATMLVYMLGVIFVLCTLVHRRGSVIAD